MLSKGFQAKFLQFSRIFHGFQPPLEPPLDATQGIMALGSRNSRIFFWGGGGLDLLDVVLEGLRLVLQLVQRINAEGERVQGPVKFLKIFCSFFIIGIAHTGWHRPGAAPAQRCPPGHPSPPRSASAHFRFRENFFLDFQNFGFS